MALFGGARPRTTMPGVVPYYPTPEEQAMAILGQASPMSPPAPRMPRGMFGASIAGGAQPGAGSDLSTIMSQALNQSAAPQASGQPGSILAGALATVPERIADPFRLPAPYGTPPIAPTAAEHEANERAPAIGWVEARDTGGGMRLPDNGSGLPDVSTLPARKPKFFGRGGLGWDILGSLGDAFAAAGGGRAIYWPQKLAQQKHQRDLMERTLQWQRQRQAERDEWTWREQWKQQHPDDQFTQYLTAAGIDPRSPQGQALYRQRAESMATPPMMAVDGFDPQGNPTKTFMPRAGIGGMGGQPSPSGPAPGTVKNGYRFNGGNPNDRNSWVPVGGASPAGGATFR